MGKIEKAAEAAGMKPVPFVQRLLTEEGGNFHMAGARIGVYPNTIKAFLKRKKLKVAKNIELIPQSEPEHA